MWALGVNKVMSMKLFKVYFWLLILIYPAIFIFEAYEYGYLEVIDYLDYLTGFLLLLGLFGYCYSKRIFTNTFWRIYFPFVVIWDALMMYQGVKGEADLAQPLFMIIMAIVLLVLVLPGYIGLYLYSYKNSLRSHT